MKPEKQRIAVFLVKVRGMERLICAVVACHVERVVTCPASGASGHTEGSA